MARCERSFSPAEPTHELYKELIAIYSHKEIDYTQPQTTLSTILDEADEYLVAHKCDPLPDCDRLK
jgi:hypothetical protein